MKIALITDTHWGCRGDSPVFARRIAKFYAEQFFPYIDKHEIKTIIHLGDILDRRKYVNFVTAKRLKEDFINPINERGIHCHIIIGNHDTYYKNTNEVNCMDVLFSNTFDKIHFYSSPIELHSVDSSIAVMPWICSGNYDECMEFIDNTKAQILFGHLDINGFEMYKGTPSSHDGLDRAVFSKFDIVCSGHFHHKSSSANIEYLGAPYEMTWSDYDDPRGFHVFNTDTRELEFIQNNDHIFYKLFYDDQDKDMGFILDHDFDQYADSVVKIVVKNKDNPHWFDLYIDKLEKAGVADLQVVEDHLNLNLEMDETILDNVEDTLSILNKYVNESETGNQKELFKLIQSLYSEALSIE